MGALAWDPSPVDCLQSAMGSRPPITPPLRAEPVLNIGGKTSEDKTDKAAVSDVAYSPERERASCLRMQDPLFWGKAITETCLIIEMLPGPQANGQKSSRSSSATKNQGPLHCHW